VAITLVNRAKMSTDTTGTGTITLGSAITGFQTFDGAGVTNGQTVRYVIEDGDNFEIGSGAYTTSGTTLARGATESSNSDSAINLSGSATVFIAAVAADIFTNDGSRSLTTTGVITGGTVEATSDTAAGDNAAIGYTAAEGLILTGQGSTNDVTIKNDADADVLEIPTGTTNVNVAGNLGVGGTVDGRDVATDGTKLDGIEASADVTDTANVTSAGALMDSEVDGDIKTLSLPANTTISAFGKTLVDDADAATARTTLGLGTAATTAASAYATAAQGTKADAALPKAGGAMTGAITTNSTFDGRDVATDGTKLDTIETGATADQTAAQILTAIKTVDGAGSGLDADTLDGLSEATFMRRSANSGLDMNNNNITDVEDIYLQDKIYHDGDTDTYIQFHAADQFRVVTGNAERLEVNNNDITMAATLQMSGHGIDMNNNDIIGVDQIIHEGDSNTYIQFHAADEFRVVTGGTERLEVNNSRTQIDTLLVTGTATFEGTVVGVGGETGFVNFNGTGTPSIRADSRISTITDNGTGIYTLAFSSSFSDANYAATCATAWLGAGADLMIETSDVGDGTPVSKTSSQIRVSCVTDSNNHFDLDNQNWMFSR
jgi:hypothetical protein